MPFQFDDTAFGKNDIRGIYGENVTEDLFFYTGKAFIRYIEQNSGKEPKNIWVTVSRDARTHSESLTQSLIKGITSIGANVVDLGMVPTPIGYFSEAAPVDYKIPVKNVEISGALIVTASHNPPEYNGLKMTYNKASMDEKEIKKVKELTRQEYKDKSIYHRYGLTKEVDIIPQYIDFMTNSFARIGEGIKVVVDSANATGGVVAPQLYRELGCEVIELYSEPDGTFPNHHPNPSDESTLEDIKAKIIEENADFGIAFDGDSDRIGVVTNSGKSITGDQLLLIFALDIIEQLKARNEVPVVISEVKCSQVLYDTINNNGGKAIMWKTGHGYIKSKMKEEKAVLAGEMSGHIFFKDRYFGFDDAVYAGCRIIEIVAKKKKENSEFKITELLTPFESACTSKEVRFKCPNNLKKDVMASLKNKIDQNPDLFGSKIKDIITLDGMRLIFEDGFALIRQSNTEPVFTLRFEASTPENLDKYRNSMIENLEKSMAEFQKEPVA